jgi:arabinofuranosyltransferase
LSSVYQAQPNPLEGQTKDDGVRSQGHGEGPLFWLLVVGAVAGHVHFANVTIDDAFISFRYADNLVRGEGLVFNPGERVEGYSNLSWTLLMAIPAALGVERFEFGLLSVAKLLGALLNLGTLALLWRTARLGRPSDPPPLMAAAYLTASLPFLVWGVSALETSLVTFSILATLYLHLSEELALEGGRSVFPWSYVVLTLAALTRPEPVVLIAPLAGVRLAHRLGLNSSWRTVKKEVGSLLLFLVPYGAFLAFRWTYYGDLLPNTYYAKMYRDPRVLYRGWLYLEHGARDLGWWFLALVVGFVLGTARSIPYRVWAILTTLFALLLITWREGGDWMPAYRLLVPTLPLIALLVHETWLGAGRFELAQLAPRAPVPTWVIPEKWLAAWRLAVTRGSARRRFSANSRLGLRLALVLALGLSVVSGHAAVELQTTSGFRHLGIDSSVHLEAARWMKKELPRDSTIALGEAGLIPYATMFPTLDLLGLTDKHLARLPGEMHTKFDANYVFEKKPDYFFLLVTRSPQGQWSSNQHHAVVLLEDMRFSHYELLRDFGTAALFKRRSDGFAATEHLEDVTLKTDHKMGPGAHWGGRSGTLVRAEPAHIKR